MNLETQDVFVGQSTPSRTADRETLLATCGCPECKEILREEEQSFERWGYDDYDDFEDYA